MKHYAGLDVSVKETSICIVDEAGRIRREMKVVSHPEDLLDRSTAISTRVRLFRLFLLIPCWESQRLIPKRSAGPRATKIGVVSLKALDHHRPNREESSVLPLNYPPPARSRAGVVALRHSADDAPLPAERRGGDAGRPRPPYNPARPAAALVSGFRRRDGEAVACEAMIEKPTSERPLSVPATAPPERNGQSGIRFACF